MRDGLTHNQTRILRHIGDGLNTKQIARRMKLSEKTVEYHRERLFTMFPRFASQVGLAKLAIGFGISALCLMCMAQEPLAVNASNASLPTPPPETATQVTIGWIPSISTNLVSQTVGWGTGTTNYTIFVNVMPNVSRYTVQNLQPATTYYIAIFCTQSIGTTGTNLVRSPWSNEIRWTTNPTVRPQPPTAAVVISSP